AVAGSAGAPAGALVADAARTPPGVARRRGLEPQDRRPAIALSTPAGTGRAYHRGPDQRSLPMAMLTEDLVSQLRGAPTSQLAQQLGISQEQASGAIGAALPLLLGALGRNASQPQGAESLFGALQKDHAGVDLGSVLGAVMGGAQGRQTDGAGI